MGHRILGMSDRYPTSEFRRTALAPGILGAIALLAGLALIGTETYTVIQYAVSILALVIAVFAWQARVWWMAVVLVLVAIVWNPVFPLPLGDDDWRLWTYVASIVFIAAAVLIRVRNTEDRNKR